MDKPVSGPQPPRHGSECRLDPNLPEPPEEDDGSARRLDLMPEPPEEDDGSACKLDPNLPEPPEEPLQSDCCGTGCTPCVFDIYQEDLERWRKLAAMSLEERAAAQLRTGGGRVQPTPAKACIILRPEEYQSFRLKGIEQVSRNAFIFMFGLPEESCVLGVGTGQHAVLRIKGSGGHSITRQYTPISRPDQRGSFSVLIKLYENGEMSQHIRNWKLGSKADWRGPFGNFTYQPNQFSHIGLLACGTGIAPMVQVARAIVENEEEETFVHCLYACRTQQDVMMKPQLDHFRTYWNFTITYALSSTTPDSVAELPGKMVYGDKIHYGRIDAELIEREMGGFLAETKERRSTVLICGTKSFDKDMINFLHRAGCTKDSYFKF